MGVEAWDPNATPTPTPPGGEAAAQPEAKAPPAASPDKVAKIEGLLAMAGVTLDDVLQVFAARMPQQAISPEALANGLRSAFPDLAKVTPENIAMQVKAQVDQQGGKMVDLVRQQQPAGVAGPGAPDMSTVLVQAILKAVGLGADAPSATPAGQLGELGKFFAQMTQFNAFEDALHQRWSAQRADAGKEILDVVQKAYSTGGDPARITLGPGQPIAQHAQPPKPINYDAIRKAANG